MLKVIHEVVEDRMQSEDCTFYDRASRASRQSNNKAKSAHQLTMDALRADLEKSENGVHNPTQTETLLGHGHIQEPSAGTVNALHAAGDNQLSVNSNNGTVNQSAVELKWDERLHVHCIRAIVACHIMEYKLAANVEEEVVESSVNNLVGNPIIVESDNANIA